MSAGTSRHLSQPNPKTHEISTEASSIGVPYDSRGSSRELLPNEPYSPSNSGNDNSRYLCSIAHDMHTGNAGNYSKVQIPGGRSGKSSFGPAQRSIDEMAEVTRLDSLSLPLDSDH